MKGTATDAESPKPSASRPGQRPRADWQPVQIPALLHVAQHDGAFLDSIRAQLDDGMLRDAVTRAVALHRERQGSADVRRPVIEHELHSIEQRMTRLVDAIATSGPVEELLDRLKGERARKAALVEEHGNLASGGGRFDTAELTARLTARVGELRRVLGLHVERVRQLLAAMLAGPVLMVPIVKDGHRGYRFSGRLRLGGLLMGEGLETRHVVVAPTGPTRFRLTVPLSSVYRRAA